MKMIVAVTFAVANILALSSMSAVTAITMNCAEADAMMLKAHSMAEAAPTMSGRVDDDFAAMEMQNAKAQVMMARVEMSCGQRADEKKSASELLRESQDRLQMLREQGLRPELRS